MVNPSEMSDTAFDRKASRQLEEVTQALQRYSWYHSIEVLDGVFTKSTVPEYQEMWDFNLQCLEKVDFRGKRVLDIGCRDGLFSFYAERRGAKEVIGLDNDLSRGAVEFLIPHFGSKVRMFEVNVYDLEPGKFGQFDIILFFGVLYHLRYPFWGLRKILDCLSNHGQLLIESGMLIAEHLQGVELLYCPVEHSPYAEPTSCTFFNQLGLEVTLRSMNARIEQAFRFERRGFSDRWRKVKRWAARLLLSHKPPRMDVAREFFMCRKDEGLMESAGIVCGKATFPKAWANSYWEGKHGTHSGPDD